MHAAHSGHACGRYLFSLKGPPSAEALTAVRAVLQALLLLASSLLFTGGWGASKPVQEAAPGGKVGPIAWHFAGQHIC